MAFHRFFLLLFIIFFIHIFPLSCLLAVSCLDLSFHPDHFLVFFILLFVFFRIVYILFFAFFQYLFAIFSFLHLNLAIITRCLPCTPLRIAPIGAQPQYLFPSIGPTARPISPTVTLTAQTAFRFWAFRSERVKYSALSSLTFQYPLLYLPSAVFHIVPVLPLLISVYQIYEHPFRYPLGFVYLSVYSFLCIAPRFNPLPLPHFLFRLPVDLSPIFLDYFVSTPRFRSFFIFSCSPVGINSYSISSSIICMEKIVNGLFKHC